MDAIDNEQGLQALIDAQYTLLSAEQATYANLQAQKLALISESTQSNITDPSSRSRGSNPGSASYTYQTVSQQLSDSANRLKELSEELKRLMELKNSRFPWIIQPRR